MTHLSVLVDTDFHKLADDHEALRMLVASQRRGGLSLTGITTVTGNAWAGVCAAHAREALKNLGLNGLEVYTGATNPILHRQSDFAHRSRLYGAAFGGAWGNSQLLSAPRAEEAARSDPGAEHAVEYIVRTLRSSDSGQTVLALGPLTNLALAFRIAPDIAARIDRLIVMGGALFVPGNVSPSAEFNWWFDAEAASIVLEQDIAVEVVPLDATDTIVFDYPRFRNWQSRYGDHPFFAKFHTAKFQDIFEADPKYTLPVWDAVAAACLIDSGVVRRSDDLWLSVDCSHGPSYGRVIAFSDARYFNLKQPRRRRAHVVLEVDPEAFWNLYESLVFTEEAHAS